MEPKLVQFHRQYMQQVQNPTYPPTQLLVHQDIQDQIYKHFFDGPLKGPPAYQRKVLKQIITLIERTMNIENEDAVSDSLMKHIAYLSTLPTRPEVEEATQPQIITYILPSPLDSTHPPRILLEEAPNLLAAGSSVGLRTWEASLHLAQYLYDNPGQVMGRNVIELGAGTGLVSLLCAGALGAGFVCATDGLPHVVERMEGNILRNRVGLFGGGGGGCRMPVAKVLDWTDVDSLLEEVLLDEDGVDMVEYDLILGADITYSPIVTPVLANLLRVLMVDIIPSSSMEALIAATVRNKHTLDVFKKSCLENGLRIEEVDFTCPSVKEQKGFFHEQAFPIVLMRITAGST